MTYRFCKPAPHLQPFIDVYYKISGRLNDIETVTLLPECGVNLFVNLGECIQSIGLEKKAAHGKIYLAGPIMKSDLQVVRNELFIFGVQFKPGGFPFLYSYDSLDQVANSFHEFPVKLFPDINNTLKHFAAYLDQFYSERLSTPKNNILLCIADIINHNGYVNIDALAKKHCTTERQLERQFKQLVGLSPKKTADIVRFRKAFDMLSTNPKGSIEEIAWECGYYDHAHMTNAFRSFTGHPPTKFILSDFSKVIANEA
jgi:AraC-like DNA-binding protein